MRDFTIRTEDDLAAAVEEFGFLPFFANSLPGFSVEEHILPELWFTDQTGPWEWKGPVIRRTGCAYGKFFEHKAAWISREWFPDFANFRRDGYDFDARFDDELASWHDNELYCLLADNAPILSGDLKKLGNYSKDGKKGFDTIITRLQSQCYIITSDFVYRKDKLGQTYGWGVAQYSTPEIMMGDDFTSRVYKHTPQESYERVFSHLKVLLPDVNDRAIERFLSSGSAAAPSRDGREAKSWLVPSNPKLYDIIQGFKDHPVHEWTQSNPNIRPGDTVYMYVGVPVGAVLFKCAVEETGIPWESERGPKLLMTLRLEKTYPEDKMTRERMRDFDVVNVRGPRFMPEEMIRELEKE